MEAPTTILKKETLNRLNNTDLFKTPKKERNLDELLDTSESHLTNTAAPWYGKTRFQIVDHCLERMNYAEVNKTTLTPIELEVMKAEAKTLVPSIKTMVKEGTYFGPLKYADQRDAPLKVARDVVERFNGTIDTNGDRLVSINELIAYIHKFEILIDVGTVFNMFYDITSRRAIKNEADRNKDLTVDEILMAVNGRYQKDPKTKEWTVCYKPYRKEWLILLLRIQDNIFEV